MILHKLWINPKPLNGLSFVRTLNLFSLLKLNIIKNNYTSGFPLQGWRGLFIRHPHHRDDHFFQAYSAVLKSVAVIIGKMIIIIGIT